MGQEIRTALDQEVDPALGKEICPSLGQEIDPVNFLKKNEITILSLRYRKAKELTVRLYGFCENAFT